MDGMTLLQEARAAGLAVNVEGDKLVIRGPRRAEAVAMRLLKYKPDVLAALRGEQASTWPPVWVGRQIKAGRQTSPSTSQVCPRCKAQEHVDHEIHGGASVRRDCARCGRFRSFPKWYGVLDPSEN
jgi:hypothetical protein